METQEIYVILLIILSIGYIAFRLIKKGKSHDCDKCGLKEDPKS